MPSSNNVGSNSYTQGFSTLHLPDQEYEHFALEMPEDKLLNSLTDSLNESRGHWNKAPWRLQDIDLENVSFLLGDQIPQDRYVRREELFQDNRLFSSTRAILAYATGQLAKPSIVPSRGDDEYIKMARSLQMSLYKHSEDEDADEKVRAAVMNLVVRKRGFLKLRFDPHLGKWGDIVTEVVPPEDIIIDRHAKFKADPNVIHQRISCTVDELVGKFPDKKQKIYQALSIKQGRWSQISKFIHYFESWFTFIDSTGKPRQAVAWSMPDHGVLLDKMLNPNWIYTGDDVEDKETNIMQAPPKPYIWFNYINFGKSFIDETCLFEQAVPVQMQLNRRGKQIWDNADYVNGRWIASKKAMSEEDAYKMVNKGSKTIGLVNAEDVRTAFNNVASPELPAYVYTTLLDSRNEIDTMMGTPSVFRGAQPDRQDTLGRDMMVKQQAGMLQDDLVKAVQKGMKRYYTLKLQMMRVYYTDDYWFQTKGADGQYDFVMINGKNVDPNVSVSVQIDSTLPLDKQQLRATAMQLAPRLDDLTLFEAVGVPEPEVWAARAMKSKLDPTGYQRGIEKQLDNSAAEMDIMLLIAGKEPDERSNYDEGYLSYFNDFMSSNRFSKLPEDAQQRLTAYLMVVQDKAAKTVNLRGSMLNDAGMIDTPDPIMMGAMPPGPGGIASVMPQGSADVAQGGVS